MRKFKKKILEAAIERLEASIDIVSTAARKERDVAENLPGNLRRSEKYDRMMSGADNLECAAMQITRAVKCIKEACKN